MRRVLNQQAERTDRATGDTDSGVDSSIAVLGVSPMAEICRQKAHKISDPLSCRFKSCRAQQFNTMNNYTDTQLKQALAKMLPELLENYYQDIPFDNFLLSWIRRKREVHDTELLHLCWLVEEKLTPDQENQLGELYRIEAKCVGPLGGKYLINGFGITAIAKLKWQQRVIALAKVKKIEIV